MAFKGDTTPIKLQLMLTNYAEGLEAKPRYHVRQISFLITTLEDVGCDTDDVLDYAQFLSAKDQEVLNWQAGTKDLQNDVEIRSTLTALSGRLCPYKNISFSLFDKVTDCDAHHQRRTDPCPFSAYRHSTFRSVMLTEHSAADGQVQLLFSCDGLPLDRSCLRWRSHDYIKLEFPNARTSSYKVFWLVQWDVVDVTDFMNEGHVATGPGTGLGNNNDRGLSLDLGGDSPKFFGTRLRKERPSPWIAELKPKGSKKKISLGSYQTQEAAARAADSGLYHYGRGRLNFQDSKKHLEEIPSDVNDEEKKKRVQDQARKLAKLAEKPPSAGMVQFSPENTKLEGFTSHNSGCINSGSDNMWLATNASFGSLPRPDGVAISSMEAYPDDVRTSASFGTVVWRETFGSSLEQEIPSTSNDWFTTNSGIPDSNTSVLHHGIERQMASTGYDSSLLVAEPEQSGSNGHWTSFLYRFD